MLHHPKNKAERRRINKQKDKREDEVPVKNTRLQDELEAALEELRAAGVEVKPANDA
jgi:hypothetical protein